MATLIKATGDQYDQVINLDHVTHINCDTENLSITFNLANSTKNQPYIYWDYLGNEDFFETDVRKINSLLAKY